MIKPVVVSINPTYLCNFRCNFCYLTEQQLSDPSRVSCERLHDMLREVQQYTSIEYVDVYGGELTALPEHYIRSLFQTIRTFYSGPINVVTNYLKPIDVSYDDNMIVTVSYDFSHREHHERVFANILNAQHPIHILTLATPGVIRGDVDTMINQLNSVRTLRSVEIKPYSSNQANQLNVTDIEFEEFVRKWITSPVHKRFDFVNEREIVKSITGNRSSFSDDHVYITPEGRFAVLEFDLNNNEYFKSMDGFADYIEWYLTEKQRTLNNTYCNQCQYLGRCLTEHLRIVKDVDQSCNGYYKLIEWYKNERMAA